MTDRIRYIDSLKGLAILTVVMGHVVSLQFPDWQDVLNTKPECMLVWSLIYSFHMPLFMFLSGLFALRVKEYTWKNVGKSIWKRVLSLILPYFVAGSVKYILLGGEMLTYWYLWMLFWFFIIVLAVDGLCSLFPVHSQTLSTITIIVMVAIQYLFLGKLYGLERLPLIDIGHMHLFLYFSMGVICARYDLCEKWFSRKGVFTCALLVFGLLTYWMTICNKPMPSGVIRSICNRVLSISAIISFIYLFKNGFKGTSKIEELLCNVGQHSLEIYILHEFFLFRTYAIGEYILQLNISGGGRTIFITQLCSSLIASLIIIVLCYTTMSVLTRSNILSQLFLGRKGEEE